MRNHHRLIRRLIITVFVMFCFSFALVPLYNALCQVSGLNGKPLLNKKMQARYKNPSDTHKKRSVIVEFDSTRNQELACEFKAAHPALMVVPGELAITHYYAKNLKQKPMIVQAIPSISPGIAAQYLKKLECFCFERQLLQPGETIELPLRFWLEPELPAHIHRLTLSYTLFEIHET